MQLPRLSGQCQQPQQPCCLPRLHAMHSSGTIPVQQQHRQQRQPLCARSQPSRTLHTVRAAAAAEQAPPAAVQADEQVRCLCRPVHAPSRGLRTVCRQASCMCPTASAWQYLDPNAPSLGCFWPQLLAAPHILAAAEGPQRRPHCRQLTSVMINATSRSTSSIPLNATCCSTFRKPSSPSHSIASYPAGRAAAASTHFGHDNAESLLQTIAGPLPQPLLAPEMVDSLLECT